MILHWINKDNYWTCKMGCFTFRIEKTNLFTTKPGSRYELVLRIDVKTSDIEGDFVEVSDLGMFYKLDGAKKRAADVVESLVRAVNLGDFFKLAGKGDSK